MKVRICIIFSFLTFSFSSISQTVATDFTSDDCDGDSHNLFSELDEGKVIVLAWTMPCFSCIAPCVSAHDAAVSFEDSNPGEVLYYLVDDYGNSSCTSLQSWGATNGFSDATTYFSNSVIDMDDYGVAGMPKVVVIGCNGGTRKVFYNQNNFTDYDGVQAAIDEALTAGINCSLGIYESPNDGLELSLYPNPTKDKTTINYSLKTTTNITMDIISGSGAIVQSISNETQNPGNYSFELDLIGLSEGIYFLRIITGDSVETKRLVITN